MWILLSTSVVAIVGGPGLYLAAPGITESSLVQRLLRLLSSGVWALSVFRFFVIAHDCVHHSFFESRRANDVLSSILTALILTPADGWAVNHLRHHRASEPK